MIALALLSHQPLPSFPLGPLTVYTWGLFVALGILAGTAVASARAARRGLPRRVVWDLSFWLVLGGLLGARLFYVLEDAAAFRGAPLKVFAIWEGGMSATGAILAGIVLARAFARRHGLSFATLADVIAPGLLLGEAIGRVGGSLSHMYGGTPTHFPIAYLLNGVARHEVGAELALASFLGYAVIHWAERRLSRAPPVALLVLLWYAFARFFLDFLRATDLPGSDRRLAGLTLAQYGALVGVAIGVVLLTRVRKQRSLQRGS